MNSLRELVSAILSEASFDLKYIDIQGNGSKRPVDRPGISAAQLAAFGQEREGGYGIVRTQVLIRAPEARMSQLVQKVRAVLACFIDPASDRLGHAFPIDRSDGPSRMTIRENGLAEFEFTSTVERFADCLVQAAAISGVDRIVQLLTRWKSGKPVRYRISTILHGLILNARLSPREDIEITPLPLETTKLPRLPRFGHLTGTDFLGQTVLSLSMSASPALYRPTAEKTGKVHVRSCSEQGITLNDVCLALSLEANRHVSHNLRWTEFDEAAPFALKDWHTWKRGDKPFQRARFKSLTTERSVVKALKVKAGVAIDDWAKEWFKEETLRVIDNLNRSVVTLEREDGVEIFDLDEEEVLRAIKTLKHNSHLSIAANRWRRSKRPNASLEDRYIDLRIALEALYLKDFANENSGEMRFRLALFGAWHLGATFEGRRDIRKTLRDAYDYASAVVHTGKLSNKHNACREQQQDRCQQAQDLCRRGIRKLIANGSPLDWGHLILGERNGEGST